MKREQAIEKLAWKQVKKLSEKERAEQLELLSFGKKAAHGDWSLLPKDIQKEFEHGKAIENPNSERYDDVLQIWMIKSLQAVSNDYIKEILGVESVEGEPLTLVACPCCGARTIEGRRNYDICRVCWWEDDGQDNERADKVFGGPNADISLTQGRYNFLIYGIFNPKRKDLMKRTEPISKYVRAREFAIEGEYVIEKGTDWKGKFTP